MEKPNASSSYYISNSAYNKRRKELLDLYQDLREMGAQSYVPDLPRICVIGNQSAGKSSLVEAVSGINVPRDSGTCTRCPMECSMSQAEEWSCTITLRHEFDDKGNTHPNPRTESFGPTLRDKSEVEIWLRRAQAAILCPHLESTEFHTKSKEDLKELRTTDNRMKEFSKNTIYVEVKDPEIIGLSFVDLPGLIQNSDTPGLIDLVKNLVISNIRQKNTLISVVIPMGDDIENQQAVRLAKEVDPLGERTIGVLTKPDTVLPSSHGHLQRWREVLEGKANSKNGYYCVRLPDEAERMEQYSRTKAEGLAEEFFRSRQPWSEMSNRRCFGVPNLVNDVSTLLVRWIEKHLPTLRRQLDGLLEACIKDINNLPSAMQRDASTEVLSRVAELSRSFHDLVNAVENKTLVCRARERYARYKIDIVKTSPDFRPFAHHHNYIKPAQIAGEDIHSDSVASPMDLEYVREVIKRSIGWELPGHVPFAAMNALVQELTCLWREPSLSCFKDVYAMTTRSINDLIRKHFGQFPNAENHIRSLVRIELEQCEADSQKAILSLLQTESQPLFTQNTHYLETEERKFHNHFSDLYHRSPCYEIGHSCISTVPCGRVTTGYNDELLVIAQVQAYFRVAYKRIIDNLPLTIEHSLNRTLNSTLQGKILTKLISPDDYVTRMEELMMEDPEIANKRQSLSERKKKLLQIRGRLPDVLVEEIDEMPDEDIASPADEVISDHS